MKSNNQSIDTESADWLNVIGLIFNNLLILIGVFFFAWSKNTVLFVLLVETAVIMVLSPFLIASLPARSGIKHGHRVLCVLGLIPRLFILAAFIAAQLLILDHFFSIETVELIRESGGFVNGFIRIISLHDLWIVVFAIAVCVIIERVRIGRKSGELELKQYAKKVNLTPFVRMALTQATLVMSAALFITFSENIRASLLILAVVLVKATVEFKLLSKGLIKL